MPGTIIKQPQIRFKEGISAPAVKGFEAYYQTDYGVAYLADSLELMKAIPDN